MTQHISVKVFLGFRLLKRRQLLLLHLEECNMKPRSWIKTMAASSLLSPRAAFRKANSTPSSHKLSKVSIPLAMLTTLTRVIEFLNDNHFEEEGLYSKPGVDVECKDLLSFFRDQKLPDLTAYNPHSIASAVKEILSNLYTPMISVDTSAELLKAVGSGRIDEAAERKITEIFKQIRSTTREFLQVFLGHLNHVSLNSQSRMSVTNLALHVGIALIRPTEDKTILSSKTMMRQRKCIAEFFIRHAGSLPYDCATEMNIPAIPELAPTPSIGPLDSSSAPLSLKQLHFVQVTWDAGESTFTPEKLEEIFGKFGEIETLGINDQGNRAIIAYISAASAKEAESASIPFVRVRRRKPRQSEKRREYSPRSAKSISSDSHLNRDAKDNISAEQAMTLLQQGTSSARQREISPSLTLEHSPDVHEPELKVLDDSIIVEDIEDDEQQPTDDSPVMLATDLHFDDSKVLSSTSSNDLQVTTDSNDADFGFSMRENDNRPSLSECRSPKVAVTPVQAEQDTPATEIGGVLESKLADSCLCTDSETKTIAQDIVAVAKEQDDDHDNVGDFLPTKEVRTGSQQLAPETESSSENLPSDTLSAASADSSQAKCSTNSVEPIEVKPAVVENLLDRVNGPDPVRHSLDSLESSMENIDPCTDQDELLTSADNAAVMDVLQSKLLDMDKILSTSTAALSMAKLSTEFEHAVLQLHNQILGLVADCLVLTGVKHGDFSDTSMINTATNAEFLDFLEAQSKTQVKILEVEVRAGQELLRLHKSQFEKERIELEEEITALRVGRTETEKLCAELRSDLRKCRCELACHVANATDIQRQKSGLEGKLVVSENQLHAREKALAKLQVEYEKMHRVAAEAQARVEKFKMGDFSGGKAVPDNQEEYHGFQSSSDGSLQHLTKFMSKHAIRANAAVETLPAEEKSPRIPEILPRTSNVAALEAMKQRMARDIQEQLASTRAALKEMEVCSSSGKTLEEEEEELRLLQKQFAARSSEVEAAMNESRSKLQELLSPAGHLSSQDDLVGFEEPKSNQEPTIFDSTALVNQLIAQAEEGSTNTFQKRWHHEDSAAEELFSIQHGDGVRNYQPAHEAQSSLYKKWTADRSRKMEMLASYRDKHAVLRAQKSMQTFQQTLAEMRGPR